MYIIVLYFIANGKKNRRPIRKAFGALLWSYRACYASTTNVFTMPIGLNFQFLGQCKRVSRSTEVRQ